MMVSDDEHDEPHDYQQARINLTSNLFLKSQMDPGTKTGGVFPTHPLRAKEILPRKVHY